MSRAGDAVNDEPPEGWHKVNLSEIARSRMGKTILAKDLCNAGNIPVYSAGRDNTPWGFVENSDLELGQTDIVLSARGSIGFPRLPKHVPFVSTQTTIAVHLPLRFLAEYVCHWLSTVDWDALTSGASIPMLTVQKVNGLQLPLPPLSEQKRIVAMVEKLLARVNAARERLAKVPAILKRFRQSVLAAACSGRLTADWRDTHPDIEAADRLISRTLAAAQEKYREQCRQAKSRGQRKPTPPVMLKPPDLDAPDLPEVPVSWTWTPLGAVSQDITVGHVGPMAKQYVASGIPFLRSLNVREFRFDPKNLKFISPEFHRRLKKSTLLPGDVAIVRSGNAGVSCVIPKHLGEANCADLVIVKPSGALVADYACIVINSAATRAHVDNVKVGIAQGHFNIGSARETPVPFPPLNEQHEIVRRVEALFNLADTIEQRVTAGKQRADKLTQAVLAKAFRGELVPTEAELARREGRSYEPASALLERIGVEREAAAKKTSPRGEARRGLHRCPRARGAARR